MFKNLKLLAQFATSLTIIYLCYSNIWCRQEINALKDELRFVRRLATDAWAWEIAHHGPVTYPDAGIMDQTDSPA
jgi:hypothetical protein